VRLSKVNNECNTETLAFHNNIFPHFFLAGDYAQMADLSGYPEIGALSLLHYYRGGSIQSPFRDDFLCQNLTGLLKNIFLISNPEAKNGNCGCGLPRCNSVSSIFLPFYDCDVVDILESLSLLDESLHNTEKNDIGAIKNNCAFRHLFFWNDYDEVENGESKKNGPNIRTFRTLPPVVKLLLLKLLYCNPIGGPFLQLSCLSITPLSSTIKRLGFIYKSHWAYFVLIRAMIEGWKVKEYRRDTIVPYHVPVKDLLNGKDERRVFGGLSCNIENNQPITKETYQEIRTNQKEVNGFVHYLCSLLKKMNEKGLENQIGSMSKNFTNENATSFTKGQFRIKCFTNLSQISHPPLFIIGDSHSISIAWQTVRISTDKNPSIKFRTAIPYPATGIKAWHTSKRSKPFFTQYNFRTILSRLPTNIKTVVVSMGEIDCREGIGGEKLQGYSNDDEFRNHCDTMIHRTVCDYVLSMWEISTKYHIQLLLLPVAPHAYRSDKNGKATGRARRRITMETWNSSLRNEILNMQEKNKSTANDDKWRIRKCYGVYLLDYEERLREKNAKSPTGYVLNKHFNADYTHMNSAFLPLLENAISVCKCDTSLI